MNKKFTIFTILICLPLFFGQNQNYSTGCHASCPGLVDKNCSIACQSDEMAQCYCYHVGENVIANCCCKNPIFGRECVADFYNYLYKKICHRFL